MPEQIRCPSCAVALRLPESLLGSSVKCPKCGSTFTAELPPPESIRTAHSRDEEREPPLPLMETEDAGEDERYEDGRARRRRRRSRRKEEAANALMGPAVGLMVVAILGILVALVHMVGQVFNLSFTRPPPGGSSAFNAGYRGPMVFCCGGDVVSALLYAFIVVGSVNMMKLRDHRSAITACIIALLPCNPCCLFGYPFAIWGLVMLYRPDIQEAFSER